MNLKETDAHKWKVWDYIHKIRDSPIKTSLLHLIKAHDFWRAETRRRQDRCYKLRAENKALRRELNGLRGK